MILILGGTTEGRKALATIDKAGKPFFYSTRGNLQQVESIHATRISGSLDAEAMTAFCSQNGIRLIVDAAHPFASQLHDNVKHVCDSLSIPAIRYERDFMTDVSGNGIILCDNFDDAIRKLHISGVGNLLALTGVKTIPKLKNFWINHECRFRILMREESVQKAVSAGFPENRLIFYENDEHISGLIAKYTPDAIITKESGDSGGFQLKISDARAAGVKIFVVKRPTIPDGFTTVTGDFGLRKAVEQLLPGFFDLRSGFTTGACATAAAKAALLSLVFDDYPSLVGIRIPNGEVLHLPVKCVSVHGDCAVASVIKDAGDDPDVTDGAEIVATVRQASHGIVRFFGGEGVGTVTLPGTGLEIGEPAINPVPRQMMTRELLALCPQGCDVTISVPDGEELAKKTFNPRIGIEGGISIIGTSGIVIPFSHEAFIETIRREFNVALATGCNHIVVNSGARSEKCVKAFYPQLPPTAFVHYGNAIGETLEIANQFNVENLSVGLMLGKAVKLAEGNMDTHSLKVTINRNFLCSLAADAGCSAAAVRIISELNMARELWHSLSESDGNRFFPLMLQRCKENCRSVFRHGNLTIFLIDDSDQIRFVL